MQYEYMYMCVNHCVLNKTALEEIVYFIVNLLK